VELYLHSPYTPSWRGAQLKAQEQTMELLFYYGSFNEYMIPLISVLSFVAVAAHTDRYVNEMGGKATGA
jgi:hypothetical protein